MVSLQHKSHTSPCQRPLCHSDRFFLKNFFNLFIFIYLFYFLFFFPNDYTFLIMVLFYSSSLYYIIISNLTRENGLIDIDMEKCMNK